MKLDEWMREFRRNRGLSLRDVARAIGVSKNYVHILEKGVNPCSGRPMIPRPKKMAALAELAGLPVEELIKLTV